MNGTSILEILKHSEVTDLHQFIVDYAKKNKEFRRAFDDRFNPAKTTEGSKKKYADMIRAVFLDNPLKTGNRYHQWEDYGFHAEYVREELQLMLDKAGYFINAENLAEAILICQALIETIPGEWDGNFDQDGDVQVMYDGAIDKLQELLAEDRLTATEKKDLFEWYNEEIKHTAKHKYVGLNTELSALEIHFSDTPEMLKKNLANIEGRISTGSDYEKENAAMSKILLLRKAGLNDEAEKAVTEYIRFQNVRKLRLEKLLKEKQYVDAIELLTNGIKIAEEEKHPGTVNSWKKELLSIYKLQENTEKILSTAEELFYDNPNGSREHYQDLKNYTTKEYWPATLERLLNTMPAGYSGFNELKADILIEHKMWDRLFAMCQKAGAEKLEQYEKYLKPLYAKEIFEVYQKYVEKQALITDQNAYNDVVRVLKKMKGFDGGGAVVESLLKEYGEIYKRRKNMMTALEGV